MPVQSITSGVLLLRIKGGGFVVCDEYTKHDQRVHILGDQCYGEFDRPSFVLEYRKAALDVAAIVYEGDDWPQPIAGSKDRDAILAHFGRLNSYRGT